ncbi:MAG: DMT family transporter [Bryobacteraceae bacterium]
MSSNPAAGWSSRFRADLALVVIAFIWGATFITTKSALAHSSVILFLAIRFSIASVALAGVYLFQREGWGGWRAVGGGTAAGTCLFAGYILQTIGLKYTTATKTGFITGLYVVVVPLLAACVYRTVPRLLEVAGVAMAGLGMALMTLPKEGWALERGDALVALSTIPYAAHLLLVVRFARWCSPVALGFYQAATGAVIGLVVYRWAEEPFIQWDGQLVAALLITGLLATAGAFTLLSWAQRSTTATRSAVILTLEPLFAWLTSLMVAGEQLSLRAGGGAILILAGILLVELKPARQPEHPSP